MELTVYLTMYHCSHVNPWKLQHILKYKDSSPGGGNLFRPLVNWGLFVMVSSCSFSSFCPFSPRKVSTLLQQKARIPLAGLVYFTWPLDDSYLPLGWQVWGIESCSSSITLSREADNTSIYHCARTVWGRPVTTVTGCQANGTESFPLTK